MAFYRTGIYGNSNVTQFRQELSNFSNQTLKRIALAAHKQVVMDLFRKVIARTAVDAGPVKLRDETRGNWRITLVHAGIARQYTSSPIGDAQASIRRVLPFQNIYIVNTVPWINYLEYKSYRPQNPGPSSGRWGHKGEVRISGGGSTQSPDGMLRISLEEIRRIPSIKVRNWGFKGVRPDP